MTARPPRSPSESMTEMTELVLPQHANALGTAFGGTVLSWMDICGAIAAQRHCGRIAVTAAIDDVTFLAPIRVGDVVRLHGWVNAAFRTSVEVQVVVEREEVATQARTPCLDALLTFVSLGPDGRPLPVPGLRCDTDEQKVREAQATERRAARLSRKRAAG